MPSLVDLNHFYFMGIGSIRKTEPMSTTNNNVSNKKEWACAEARFADIVLVYVISHRAMLGIFFKFAAFSYFPLCN